MNRHYAFPISALLLIVSGSLPAQAVLRPGQSTRATTEVTLAYPRPAGAMAAMPGMAPSTNTSSNATTAAPSTATPTTTAASTNPGTAAAAMPAMPADSAAKPPIIRLDYGQPHLRGRRLHTDSLVPFDKPWRMGANGSTTLTTDVDLVVGGATLTKGKYVLYTLPGRKGWKLIIQRSVGQSAMTYADSNDVVRVDLRHSTLKESVESLTMWLIPSREPGPARGELRYAWGRDQLSTDWSIK